MPSTRQNNEFRNAIHSSSLLDDAIEWIRENLSPEDVFETKQLDMWAEENGFRPKE